MSWLHDHGLASSVNIHDDNGVQTTENEFAAMAKALGLNPSTCGDIPFDIANSTYAFALDDIGPCKLGEGGGGCVCVYCMLRGCCCQ